MKAVWACPLTLLLLAPATALSCECVEPSATKAYRQSYAVVQATVLERRGSDDSKQGITAVLRPTRAWKQSVEAEMEVHTATTCAFDFKPDQDYLLYLHRSASTGRLSTHACMGNREATQAQTSMDWLQRHGRTAEITPRQRAK